jgi:cyclohexanone monooxygenase
MLHALRAKGFKVLGLEAGESVGGAWYWNRYPGARCDVESLVYSYSFSPIIDAEWTWSERYAAQPEILRYLDFVADRLDLRKDFRFGSRLVEARFDETTSSWLFLTEQGAEFRARYFVSAAGPISAPIWPDIPCREEFGGDLYHTATWPQENEPDFTGKRVGVIGTGSSGTQVIPLIAEKAERLNVFVRTPSYYAPAKNRPLNEEDLALWSKTRGKVRKQLRSGEILGSGDVLMSEEMLSTRQHSALDFSKTERKRILDERWQFGGTVVPRAFADVMTELDVNEEISEYLRDKVHEMIDEPNTAEILTPRGHRFGTRRICIGTNYYETFNRANVSAFDVKARPIRKFTPSGLIVGDEEIELDAIVCASGFDALTGALTAIDIYGLGGKTIKDAWSAGADSYLGLGVAGFPNLLMIGGPGSPSVLVNVVMANEVQVEWITELICFMRAKGLTCAEVREPAQAAWTKELARVIEGTVMTTSESWYVGANVPGKPRRILAYAGGIASYIARLGEEADSDYDGFRLS